MEKEKLAYEPLNIPLVDEYYRGFKEGEEHAKQRILIEMLPFLNDTQQRRLRNILENIDEPL